MSTRFTISHLQQLKAEGKIRDYSISEPEQPATKKVKLPKKKRKQVQYMHDQLKIWCLEKGRTLELEHRFHPARKWRFDFAVMELKIAIEYEGINSEKSRHTTITGYSADADKYNNAQALGWKVLRFTALNYKSVIDIIEKSIV